MNKRTLTLLVVLLLMTATVVVPQDPPPQTAAQQTPGQAGPVLGAAAAPNPNSGPKASGLALNDAPLTAVIDQLARLLKINYQIDPRVVGTVTLNTYGQPADLDARELLDFLLRINNAGMIQEGDIYRIVPMNDLVRQPISQTTNSASIPDDERTMLNMIFLKYVTVGEVSKILTEFADEHTVIKSYAPANLLFILDSRRDMRRLMDLIEIFDSDTFAAQRVRLFEIENTRPSELVKDLEAVLRSLSLNSSTSTVHFLPVDRLNMLIATAPNPGVFDTVETWIKKLDVPLTSSSTVVDTYVYNVNYGRADCLSVALNQLYSQINGTGYGGYSDYQAGYGGGYPNAGYGGGGYPQGGMGGGYGGGGVAPLGNTNSAYGNQNSFSGGFGGSGACGSTVGGNGGGYGGGVNNGGGGYGYPTFNGYNAQAPIQTLGSVPQAAPAGAAGANGASGNGQSANQGPPPPRIVANPLANSLLIQGNAQQYQSILKLLKELDRPPRQILLEAKIYSVAMTGSFAAGVKTQFAARDGQERRLLGGIEGQNTLLQAGTLVGQSRQLMAFLNMQENRTNVRVISEPSLIATDSIPASINVGTQVPVLTGQLSTIGGTSGFTSQGISSHNTGATLQVNARINPSGVVTLIINQEVSKAVPPASGGIQTPSFDQQVVQTQIMLHDGDTIAIGGIIAESSSNGSAGLPFLSRIPYFGALFGSQSYSKDRSELILFMTPHVIYDTTDLLEASDELKARVKKLKRYIQ